MRMSISPHVEGNDVIWAIKFQRSTQAAMVDDRRLQLRVNQMGVVVAASAGTPGSLFGVEPEKVLGMELTSLVDVFHEYSLTGWWGYKQQTDFSAGYSSLCPDK
jgi:hypothetical protein